VAEWLARNVAGWLDETVAGCLAKSVAEKAGWKRSRMAR
jgi:hypothetical protein